MRRFGAAVSGPLVKSLLKSVIRPARRSKRPDSGIRKKPVEYDFAELNPRVARLPPFIAISAAALTVNENDWQTLAGFEVADSHPAGVEEHFLLSN